MSPWRLVSFASTAPSLAAGDFVTVFLLKLRSLLGLRKSTWIYKASPIIAYPDAQGEYVDFPSLLYCERHGFEVQKEVLRGVSEKSD